MPKLEHEGGKIKPVGYIHEYTPEQLEEFAKCIRSPIHFIRNYVKIVHPTRGLVPFKLWNFQERMLENYLAFNRVISMLPRQVGKTQTTAAFLLWWSMFKPHQTILVAANKGRSAAEIMSRFKQMYEELPWWIKPGVTVNNVMSMRFENGSSIEAVATTGTTGRGMSISLLYLDEFAYVQPNIQQEFWLSISPTLATGGRAIITSTPNTDEDKFAQIWFAGDDAENSYAWDDTSILDSLGLKPRIPDDEYDRPYETVYEDESMGLTLSELYGGGDDEIEPDIGFKRFFVHWMEHPDRDVAFKRKTLREGTTLQEWNREFECQFVSGDQTLIDSSKLIALNSVVRKPKFVDRYGGQWYRNIRPNVTHAVTLDPSEGVEGDNAVIQVWELPTMRHVCEWAANDVDQVEQTRMLFRVLKRIYDEQQRHPEQVGESDIYYSVECNGAGMGILNAIEIEGEDKFPGELIDSDGNKVRGIRTTERSKRDYAVQLKVLIERGIFLPASKALVSELKAFVKRGRTYAAKPGAHDDRVMACVLMCHLFEELKFMEDGVEEALHIDLVELEEDEDPDMMPLPPII